MENSFVFGEPFLVSLITAVGCGFILGLEREFNHGEKTPRFAGIRTFPLVAVLGCSATFAAQNFSPWLLPFSGLALTALLVLFYLHRTKAGDFGLATEISLFIVFITGSLAAAGYEKASLAITVFSTLILSLKFQLQTAVSKLTVEEVYAILKFIILTLLIFPFLPDKGYGPNQLFNPHDIGSAIVIVSGISFLGYFLVKYIGPGKGIFITALLGGIISSTALTWDFSARSQNDPVLRKSYAGGIMIACSIMFFRVTLLSLIFNTDVFVTLAIPCVILGAIGSLYSWWIMARANPGKGELNIGNPLNLAPAFTFGVFYIFIVFVLYNAEQLFGKQGLIFSSGLAGFGDVDALTIGVSRLAKTQVLPVNPGSVIMTGLMTNTLTKTAVTIWRAPAEVKIIVGKGLGVFLIGGIIYLFFGLTLP